MNKVNLKKAMYVLLSIAALLLYRKIFLKVSAGSNSFSTEKEQIKVNSLSPFQLSKIKEPLGEIINPFYKSNMVDKKYRKTENFKQRTVLVKERELTKERVLPKITYHGTIGGNKGGVSAYLIIDGKMYLAKENIQLEKNIVVKKIWSDSIRVKVYDQNEMFYR